MFAIQLTISKSVKRQNPINLRKINMSSNANEVNDSIIDDIAMQCPFHSSVPTQNGHVTVAENNTTTNFGDEINPHLYSLRERLTVEDVRKTEVTYANYINTEKLLSLQGTFFEPLFFNLIGSDIKQGLHHHDEHLFILVHQGFELWFKQILHELTSVSSIIRFY